MTLVSSSRSRVITLIWTPRLVDLMVGWVGRYLAASLLFKVEQQARMTREALNIIYGRAASRPRPAFSPVTMIVLPVKLVPT